MKSSLHWGAQDPPDHSSSISHRSRSTRVKIALRAKWQGKPSSKLHH